CGLHLPSKGTAPQPTSACNPLGTLEPTFLSQALTRRSCRQTSANLSLSLSLSLSSSLRPPSSRHAKQSVQPGSLLGSFPCRLTADTAAEAHLHKPLVAYVQQRHFITRKPLLGLGQGHQTQAYPRRATTPHPKSSGEGTSTSLVKADRDPLYDLPNLTNSHNQPGCL
ncbi:hypothetical protein CORC01_07155, partial [Colletotrichum orchidophilum]